MFRNWTVYEWNITTILNFPCEERPMLGLHSNCGNGNQFRLRLFVICCVHVCTQCIYMWSLLWFCIMYSGLTDNLFSVFSIWRRNEWASSFLRQKSQYISWAHGISSLLYESARVQTIGDWSDEWPIRYVRVRLHFHRWIDHGVEFIECIPFHAETSCGHFGPSLSHYVPHSIIAVISYCSMWFQHATQFICCTCHTQTHQNNNNNNETWNRECFHDQ